MARNFYGKINWKLELFVCCFRSLWLFLINFYEDPFVIIGWTQVYTAVRAEDDLSTPFALIRM